MKRERKKKEEKEERSMMVTPRVKIGAVFIVVYLERTSNEATLGIPQNLRFTVNISLFLIKFYCEISRQL